MVQSLCQQPLFVLMLCGSSLQRNDAIIDWHLKANPYDLFSHEFASVGSWPVFSIYFFSNLWTSTINLLISTTCIQGSTAWWPAWKTFGTVDGFIISPIGPLLCVITKGYHLHMFICLANLKVWLFLTHSSAKRCARELSLVFCSVYSVHIDRHVADNPWALIKLSFHDLTSVFCEHSAHAERIHTK